MASLPSPGMEKTGAIRKTGDNSRTGAMAVRLVALYVLPAW